MSIGPDGQEVVPLTNPFFDPYVAITYWVITGIVFYMFRYYSRGLYLTEFFTAVALGPAYPPVMAIKYVFNFAKRLEKDGNTVPEVKRIQNRLRTQGMPPPDGPFSAWRPWEAENRKEKKTKIDRGE